MKLFDGMFADSDPSGFRETTLGISDSEASIEESEARSSNSSSLSFDTTNRESVQVARPDRVYTRNGSGSSPLENSRKRKTSDNGDFHNKRPKHQPIEATVAEEGACKRFACPYYKRKPNGSPKATSCVYPGFTSISRLKYVTTVSFVWRVQTLNAIREHLYRHHALPLRCSRCRKTFANEESLDRHLRRPLSQLCVEVQRRPEHEGFSKWQAEQLRSKRRCCGWSEEQKWNAVYRILFPEDLASDTPSPCEYYGRAFKRKRGLTKIADCQQSISPEHEELSQYESFGHRILPQLVRKKLKEAASSRLISMEPQVRRELIEIFLVCHHEALTLFKTQETPSRTTTGSDCQTAESPLDGAKGPAPVTSKDLQTSIDDILYDFEDAESTQNSSSSYLSFSTNADSHTPPNLFSANIRNAIDSNFLDGMGINGDAGMYSYIG